MKWETETKATSVIVPPFDATKMKPHPKHYRLPEQITTTEELGKAMAYQMNRQEQKFRVQFIGDINQFSHAYTFRLKYKVMLKQAQHVRRKVNQIVKKIHVDWSDEQEIRYVNDYIVRHTTYRLKSKESPYTPYSILMNEEGVCDEYALTTLLVLEAAGIEVRYIDGKVSSGLHA